MKLLPGIVVSGIALIVDLLLCAAIHSPTLWLVTWIVCMAWGVIVLGTSLYLAIGRSFDREVEETRRRLSGR
jgi:hypothetical protein